MTWNILKAGVAITGAALLFACGDDSSSGTDNSQIATGMDSAVESIDDLLDCSSKHEGESVFVKEDEKIYVCTDGDWVVSESGDEGDEDDDDGSVNQKSSSSKAKSSSSGKDKFSSSVKSSSSKAKSSSSVESSSSAGNGDGKSSSSSKAKSSSSGKDKSSSSVKSSSSKAKSSSSVESSSSAGNDDGKSSSSATSEGQDDSSSSSSVIASSSSEEWANSSSSDELSSSSRSLFEMSKDEFLNPKISYGEMTDARDGQKYKIVKIGDQVWMAENLNYDYNKGTAKSYCYDDKEANCAVTGRLYTWAAAIDSASLANDANNPQTCGYGKICTLPTVVQGVCPEGWHLPTNAEWNTLFNAVGGSNKAGTALKSQTGWKSQTGDADDRDAYGFFALPAGYRNGYGSGYFNDAGGYADFWSASQVEDDSDRAYFLYLDYYDASADLDNDFKNHGYSVRCLQN
ncbi:MAG: fibrobacter succinogenes major paralogous domain-containing protein [Fibrobacter sp.]|nr:fibrobacter succinogenes major paralogous domain-containing protein [Fibrobacter sp.]